MRGSLVLKLDRAADDHPGVAPPRILAYSPYSRWTLHGRQELTLLHALRLRGAEVQYVLCDGLYSECDQFWGAVEPRPAGACQRCQADQARNAAEVGMDYRWLGRYLTTDEEREALRWVAALAPEELLDATYGDWPVGEWVRLSLHSHFRANELDVALPEVESAARRYVASGLIACFALSRLLDESAPDQLLLFNGRMSSTRVALELARARGIRVVVHERGLRHEHLTLAENVPCHSLDPVREVWRDWGEIPLTRDELADVEQVLADRAQGRKLSWKAFTAGVQSKAVVREQLGLSAHRPLWVLFTSSDDETAGAADYASPFATQGEWIARTIEHARRHPEIDLLIRVHPNTGSKRSLGANVAQLEQLERLGAGLPPNVRMIRPEDEISSYTLMDLCTVGLVWVSTVGLELACRGKAVVVAAGNAVHGTPFVRTVTDAAGFEDELAALTALAPGAVSAQTRRLALRFAHGYFVRSRIPFELVSNPTPPKGELAWRSVDELLPGRHAGLDRCMRILLDREPVTPPPNAAERARTTADEDALLAGFGPARLTALAFAEEIIGDATLLLAWARAFDGRTDATLVIHTLADQAEQLVRAVTEVGLDGEDGPDLLACEADPGLVASVDAIFSRVALADDAFSAPRYDDTSVARLAA
jgi:hypothetical protein